jgi:uncharacterized protein (DUF1501 family)
MHRMHRRSFLQTASWAALGQLAGASPLRSISALAQSAANSSGDYKALVCVFLRGGNDSNNMIVPLSGSQYNNYNSARGPLALSQNSLLGLNGVGYGVHPSMPNLQQAYNSGQAAVVANVGPLVQPTTVQQYNNLQVSLPDALMAHDSQQETWESGGYHSGTGPGWAGLMADQIDSSYNSANLPMVTLLGGATNFGTGLQTAPFTAKANASQSGFWCSQSPIECYTRQNAAQQLLTFNTGVNLVQADQAIYQSAYQYNNFYNGVLQGAAPLRTQFPSSNALAGALQTIATMIQLRSQIGARRQVFLINFGSFDTHQSQLDTHSQLLGQLDGALGIFISAMQELGVYNDVTLFSASDFARTLTYNSSLGSDHAWGSHHFALGGAVRGGRIYGTFPSLQLNGQNDIDGTGRWVPTTALSQYMATMASWFGVGNSQLPSIFPGLTNFSQTNLGFV